jgi:hypothetical protein
VINTNSPLQLDIPMAEGIIDFAEAGQVLIITPFRWRVRWRRSRSRRADARACRGASRHHARAERTCRDADPLRQLYLERRHEVGFAGIRHARVPRPRSAPASLRAISRCRGVVSATASNAPERRRLTRLR